MTDTIPSLPRVAFLGLGRMGLAMATRLLDAGAPLAAWNRTADRATPLAGRGAVVAASPADAARDAAVVLCMLSDGAAVERALLAPDGALAALPRDGVVVDCSTVGPEASRRFADACHDRGVAFVDAPVLGSVPAATQGTLTILVGAADDVLARVRPLLDVLGRRTVHAGSVGSGSALKLVMNLLVGGITELLGEAILLAERSGIERATLKETIEASVLQSPFLAYKAPQLLERRFDPLFTTRLLLKDLNLALGLATAAGLRLPATDVVRDAYARAVDEGHGDDDFSSVIAALEGEAP